MPDAAAESAPTPRLTRRRLIQSAAVAATAGVPIVGCASTQLVTGKGTAPPYPAPGEDVYRYEINYTDAEWRARLTPDEYRMMRQGGTEPPRSSPLWTQTAAGRYLCKGCDLWLYDSARKVVLEKGWVFFRHCRPNSVLTSVDNMPDDAGRPRAPQGIIEAHCRRCGCHLGHILVVENILVHCINGIALNFVPSNA
ncbi:MAG: peptide-methionine (R)-S-oxide reductase [Planctomycetota bacterium]